MATWQDLPDDVLRSHVAPRLGRRDVAALARTSRAGARSTDARMRFEKHLEEMRDLAWRFEAKYSIQIEDYGSFIDEIGSKVGHDARKTAPLIGPAFVEELFYEGDDSVEGLTVGAVAAVMHRTIERYTEYLETRNLVDKRVDVDKIAAYVAALDHKGLYVAYAVGLRHAVAQKDKASAVGAIVVEMLADVRKTSA